MAFQWRFSHRLMKSSGKFAGTVISYKTSNISHLQRLIGSQQRSGIVHSVIPHICENWAAIYRLKTIFHGS